MAIYLSHLILDYIFLERYKVLPKRHFLNIHYDVINQMLGWLGRLEKNQIMLSNLEPNY